MGGIYALGRRTVTAGPPRCVGHSTNFLHRERQHDRGQPGNGLCNKELWHKAARSQKTCHTASVSNQVEQLLGGHAMRAILTFAAFAVLASVSFGDEKQEQKPAPADANKPPLARLQETGRG